MRRVLVTLGLVVAATLVGPPRPALACSCLRQSVDSGLRSADAAFVGRMLYRDEPPRRAGTAYNTGETVPYVFDVERVVKGSLGRTVTVYSSLSGASCGLGESVRRQGLFLRRGPDGEWRSGLCSRVEAEKLLGADRDSRRRAPLTAAATVLLGGVAAGAYVARRSVRRSG